MLAVPYSHGETPHYHRRYGVSISEFGMGSGGTTAPVPPVPCYQTVLRSDVSESVPKIFSQPPKQLRRCKVKPHGSLVPLSQRIAALQYPAYQRRRLLNVPFQETLSLRRTHLGASFVLRCFVNLLSSSAFSYRAVPLA